MGVLFSGGTIFGGSYFLTTYKTDGLLLGRALFPKHCTCLILRWWLCCIYIVIKLRKFHNNIKWLKESKSKVHYRELKLHQNFFLTNEKWFQPLKLLVCTYVKEADIVFFSVSSQKYCFYFFTLISELLKHVMVCTS